MTGGDGLVRWRPDHRCYSISIWLAEAVAKYMKLSNHNQYKTPYKRSVSSLRPLTSCCLGNHKCHFEEEIPSVHISGKITYPLSISIGLMQLVLTHLWKFIRIFFCVESLSTNWSKTTLLFNSYVVSYRGWIQISISLPSWLRICRLSNLGKGNLPCRLGSRPSSWVWLSTCVLHVPPVILVATSLLPPPCCRRHLPQLFFWQGTCDRRTLFHAPGRPADSRKNQLAGFVAHY